MNALRSWLHRINEILHANRKQFIRYLLLTFLPFILISLLMNIRFLQTQRSHTVSILRDVTLQAGNQLGFLYSISTSIAQHVSNSLILQDDILVSPGSDSDFQRMNRNIIKLNSLVNTYQFFEQISSIRFFLPDELIVADGEMLQYADVLDDRAWYQEYLSQPLLHRWYVTDGFCRRFRCSLHQFPVIAAKSHQLPAKHWCAECGYQPGIYPRHIGYRYDSGAHGRLSHR